MTWGNDIAISTYEANHLGHACTSLRCTYLFSFLILYLPVPISYTGMNALCRSLTQGRFTRLPGYTLWITFPFFLGNHMYIATLIRIKLEHCMTLPRNFVSSYPQMSVGSSSYLLVSSYPHYIVMTRGISNLLDTIRYIMLLGICHMNSHCIPILVCCNNYPLSPLKFQILNHTVGQQIIPHYNLMEHMKPPKNTQPPMNPP